MPFLAISMAPGILRVFGWEPPPHNSRDETAEMKEIASIIYDLLKEAKAATMKKQGGLQKPKLMSTPNLAASARKSSGFLKDFPLYPELVID